ncbi:hypothetical protein BH18ACT8_BH18ACT8_00720 [soil metagenome]
MSEPRSRMPARVWHAVAWAAAALLVLVWVAGNDGTTTGALGGAPTSAAVITGGNGHQAPAAAAVSLLDAALTAADRDDRLTGASRQARSWATTVQRNLSVLGVEEVSLRFLDMSASPGRSAEGGFVGEVEVRWTPEDDSETSPIVVPLRFDASGFPVDVANSTPAADPLPVWLAGRLRVVPERGVELIGVGHKPHLERLRLMVARAARDVRAALPIRPRVVSVVVPPDAETANGLLGSATEDLARIAAVTASVDGSDSRNAPVQVVLNAPVFDALGGRAAKFVLVHEMTHATTGATTSAMPLWVVEGFADHFALRATPLPVSAAAGQILARVDRAGPPHRLPTPADFASEAPGLGQAYEAAWLAFRMLAQRYGNTATVGFYLRIRDGASLRRSLGVLGLNPTSLTAGWRDYLRDLAAASS